MSTLVHTQKYASFIFSIAGKWSPSPPSSPALCPHSPPLSLLSSLKISHPVFSERLGCAHTQAAYITSMQGVAALKITNSISFVPCCSTSVLLSSLLMSEWMHSLIFSPLRQPRDVKSLLGWRWRMYCKHVCLHGSRAKVNCSVARWSFSLHI